MMEITREHVISAAHRLYEYGGRCERLHGHNYRILVTLTADRMNELGMVVDFVEVKRVLLAPWRKPGITAPCSSATIPCPGSFPPCSLTDPCVWCPLIPRPRTWPPILRRPFSRKPWPEPA